MPKHFIIGFEDENEINGDPIKFYINPFSKGAILNRQDLEIFLKREKLKKSLNTLLLVETPPLSNA